MDDIPDNFGALEKEFSSYKKSKAVILPVPYEGTVTYGKGTANGPKAIIESSKNMELYDIELDKEISNVGIHTLKELKVEKQPENVISQVYDSVKKIINDNKFPVVLGGEHSITLGAVNALKEKYNNLSVLQIDAHSDLRNSYEGTMFSHACVMRRVIETCQIVQVGIRSMDIEEAEFIKKTNHKNIFFAKDMHNNWQDKAINLLTNNVYITIDLDGLNPSIMPSTGTPEPGGMLWYQTINFLRKVAENKNIVGFDVVELAPVKENHAPDFLAAKLTYKLMGYSLLK